MGWEQACHLTTLEILGYRSNRGAMFRVGERFPWRTWADGAPSIDELLAAALDSWTLRGVRPANQPRLRLEQYRAWMQRAPDWPERLTAWSSDSRARANVWRDAARFRREAGMPRLRERIAEELTGNELGGTRLDTWICNLLLPFRAARETGEQSEYERLWQAWYPGDAPESVLAAVAQLATPELPLVRANGIVQGMLGRLLARQRSATNAELPAAGG